MDWTILRALNDFAFRHDLFEDPVTRYVGLSEIVFVGLLAVLFLLVRGERRNGARAALSAGVSAGLALLVAQPISQLVARPRPFVDHPSLHVFISHGKDYSFPSDHATAAFAIAVAIALRSRAWGAVALVLATVLAVGRVVSGVHYPSDVVGGAALGTAAALLLWAPPLRVWLDRLADVLAGGRDFVYRRLGLSART